MTTARDDSERSDSRRAATVHQLCTTILSVSDISSLAHIPPAPVSASQQPQVARLATAQLCHAQQPQLVLRLRLVRPLLSSAASSALLRLTSLSLASAAIVARLLRFAVCPTPRCIAALPPSLPSCTTTPADCLQVILVFLLVLLRPAVPHHPHHLQPGRLARLPAHPHRHGRAQLSSLRPGRRRAGASEGSRRQDHSQPPAGRLPGGDASVGRPGPGGLRAERRAVDEGGGLWATRSAGWCCARTA